MALGGHQGAIMPSRERLMRARGPSKRMAAEKEPFDLDAFRAKAQRAAREYWRYAFDAGKKDA